MERQIGQGSGVNIRPQPFQRRHFGNKFHDIHTLCLGSAVDNHIFVVVWRMQHRNPCMTQPLQGRGKHTELYSFLHAQQEFRLAYIHNH